MRNSKFYLIGFALMITLVMSVSCAISIDVAPIFSVDSPETGTVVGTNFTVSGTVQDTQTLIKGVYVSINDGEFATVSGTANLDAQTEQSWSHNVIDAPFGYCVIEAYSEDIKNLANTIHRYRRVYVGKMETEPNNTKSDSSIMTTNTAFIGNISSTDTIDIYRLSIPTNGYYTVETMASPYSEDTVDTEIEVRLPNGTIDETDNDDGDGSFSRIFFYASGPAEYEVRVFAYGGATGDSATGNYSIVFED